MKIEKNKEKRIDFVIKGICPDCQRFLNESTSELASDCSFYYVTKRCTYCKKDFSAYFKPYDLDEESY